MSTNNDSSATLGESVILPKESTENSPDKSTDLSISQNEPKEPDTLPNDAIGQSTNVKNVRIAVIGSGIGGASATHFLRKSLGEAVHIDVFEKSDRMGGRLLTATVNGETFETGGTIIHSSNRYMMDFTKEMGLETNIETGDERIGIWNGTEFIYTDSSMEWWNNIKMVWRYGLFNLKRLNDAAKNGIDEFNTIYEEQEQGKTFKTVPDFLKTLGGEYSMECTQKTSREILKEKGISDKLIDEYLNAILRTIYDQTADEINGFTGFVALGGGGEGGSLWNVKGGNYQVPQRLIEESKAKVYYNTKITSINKQVDDSSGKSVYTLEGFGDESIYDAVIVSVPLEVPDSFITCPEVKDWPRPTDLGRFQRCVSNIIQKPLNPQYFGFKSDKKLPSVILTNSERDASEFGMLEVQKNVHGKVTDPPVYRVFTREPMSEEYVRKLFIIEDDAAPEFSSVDWLAYPHYAPPEKFVPFELDDGIFYVNAIERAASAMEMSAIGGRNAALLTMQYLDSQS